MMEQNGLYADGVYDENGYMEQEEEWEREGLLDPAWEKQQKKVSWIVCAVIKWCLLEQAWKFDIFFRKIFQTKYFPKVEL